MPAEKITTTTVNNGDDSHTLTLRIAWAPRVDADELPEGWVARGFLELDLVKGGIDGTNEAEYSGLLLTEEEVDHLLRVLRRAKRKVWPTGGYDLGTAYITPIPK